MKAKNKKRSKLNSVIAILGDIVFIFALVFLLSICYTIYKGDVPGIFGYKALRIVTSSMEPLMEKGDCILIKEITPQEVKVGDIISFFSSDPMLEKYVNTHRVEAIFVDDKGNYIFTTRGDDNKYDDYYPALGENLIGVYDRHLPFEKVINFMFNTLSNKVYYFILMILPIIFCLIESMVSIIRITMEIISGKNNEQK